MTSLADLGVKLDRIAAGVDDPRAIKAAAIAAKRVALEVAADVAGSDRRLSGWGRKGVVLGAGTDNESATSIALNLRPSGVWRVMEDGRKGGGTITPKVKGRGKNKSKGKALMTPQGPRASAKGSVTTGKRAVTRTVTAARTAAPKAAADEIGRMLREVF